MEEEDELVDEGSLRDITVLIDGHSCVNDGTITLRRL